MPEKKSRISKDAFDWIKDTTEESAKREEEQARAQPKEKPTPGKRKEKKTTKARSEPARKKATGKEKKVVFIKFGKDGTIIAMAEFRKVGSEKRKQPFLRVSPEERVAEFELSGELADKRMVDVHSHYKVDLSGKKPHLVRKD